MRIRFVPASCVWLAAIALCVSHQAVAQTAERVHASTQSAFAAGIFDLCIPLLERSVQSPPVDDPLAYISRVHDDAGWQLGSSQPVDLISALSVSSGATPGDAILAEDAEGEILSVISSGAPVCRIAALNADGAASALTAALGAADSGWVELPQPAVSSGSAHSFARAMTGQPADLLVTVVADIPRGSNPIGLTATAELMLVDQGVLDMGDSRNAAASAGASQAADGSAPPVSLAQAMEHAQLLMCLPLMDSGAPPAADIAAQLGFALAPDMPRLMRDGGVEQAWRVPSSEGQVLVGASSATLSGSSGPQCYVTVSGGEPAALGEQYAEFLTCAGCPFERTEESAFPDTELATKKYDWRMGERIITTMTVENAARHPELEYDLMAIVYSVP